MRRHGPIRRMPACIYSPGRRSCRPLQSPRWSQVSGVVCEVSFPNAFPSRAGWIRRRQFAWPSPCVNSVPATARSPVELTAPTSSCRSAKSWSTCSALLDPRRRFRVDVTWQGIDEGTVKPLPRGCRGPLHRISLPFVFVRPSLSGLAARSIEVATAAGGCLRKQVCRRRCRAWQMGSRSAR